MSLAAERRVVHEFVDGKTVSAVYSFTGDDIAQEVSPQRIFAHPNEQVGIANPSNASVDRSDGAKGDLGVERVQQAALESACRRKVATKQRRTAERTWTRSDAAA